MASSEMGWWRQHGLTIVVLLTAFTLALVVRSIFAYQIFQQWGWLYVYGGGSDSFYHSRVMAYIIQNHTNLITDPLLRYPTPPVNPREPLFDWMNAVLGILFQGWFSPSDGQPAAVVAGAYFLDIQSPVWAAFGVLPTYLIGREVSSKRMGLIAAMIYPFMVASIESSGLGYANYLTFYTFVMLVTVYGYLRLIRAAGHRRWVASYRRPREIPRAIRAMLRYERPALKWAVFTGVCLGALALSWQGYPFFIAALVGFLVVQMIVERIRRIDSFALYIFTAIVGIVGFPMAMPYYFVQGGDVLRVGLFTGWFEVPLLVFFGALAILLPFLLLRDMPWVISVPALLATALIGVGILFFVDVNAFTTIVTGQGYFVKTLVYSTVAEAQAPSIDSLILGFGVLTFFLAFVGLALFAVKIGRQRFRREHVMFFVFAIISVYLPITAAKFFLLGSAVFALLPAEVLVIILDVAGYGQLRRNVASLSDRRGQFTSFRRSFKPRHVLVMGLILLILVPNVWYAVDAGIPYNIKSQFDNQVYSTLPPPLRVGAPASSTGSTYYLGAAGTSLDTPNQYDESGYNWLATQDTNLPAPQRPAFVSWWDYGFQAAGQGQHPTVADNFQNGIDPAGAFLLSQNESQAIAVLAVELLSAEQYQTHQPYFGAALSDRLAADGLNVSTLRSLMTNTSADVPLVIAHPERYLPVDASHLDPQNAMYMAASWFIANSLPVNGVAQVYNDVQAYTGWSIRYAMVDTRLFPLSGSNTGIFYAPADLTDRIIGPGGTPSSFFNVTVIGSDGNSYPLGQTPPTVTPVNQVINYFPPFYQSMIYRVFAGYNGTDIGQGDGIPGLSGSLAQGSSSTGTYYPEPGWMLSHFELAYMTAYYCPPPSAHQGCVAMNDPQARALAARTNGSTVQDVRSGSSGLQSYYTNGESMLAYYPGQTLLGTVALPSGAAVPNARVTVYDSWGIPHQSVMTDRNGAFQLTLPPGNDTVNVTTGTLNALAQAGTTILSSTAIQVPSTLGYSSDAPPRVETFTLKPASVSGFVWWNAANNTTYNPATDRVLPGASVNLYGAGLPAFHTTTDASGTYVFPIVPPGVYNLTVVYGGQNYTQPLQYLSAGVAKNQTVPIVPGELSGSLRSAVAGAADGATVTVTGPNGVVGTATASGSGSYTVGNLAKGNYTVRAVSASGSYASSGEGFAINATGDHVKLNLTLVPTITVELTVLSNGNPVGGLPVRFAPLSAPALPGAGPNATNASIAALSNATTFLVPPSGTLLATLPLGNYSVYSAGLIGSRLYAGFLSAYLPASGSVGPFALPPLVVSPAYRVQGYTPPPASGVPPTDVTISAYTAHGDSVSARANLSGDWLLVLPAGSYGIAGTTFGSGSASSGTAYAALGSINVTSDMSDTLSLGPAILWHASLGTLGGKGAAPVPASGALVQVSEQPGGALLSTLADGRGNLTIAVPASLPPGASLCLNVSAYGFLPYGRCGLTPTTLGALGSIALSLHPITAVITFQGFPLGVPIHLNATAVSPPAVGGSWTGGPTFTLGLLPGRYTLTAWAPSPNGFGVYRPPGALNVSFPVGFNQENLTITLYHQLPTRGTLALAPGLYASSVGVRLSGPAGYAQNVSGSGYVGGFLTAPGNYTVFAEGSAGNRSYANITRIYVDPTGTVHGGVALTSTGGLLHGNLTTPTGRPNGTVAVNLTGPYGLRLDVLAQDGAFSLVLPNNTMVIPTVNVTLPTGLPGGVTGYARYTQAPGSSCSVRSGFSSCVVRLLATPLSSTIAGTVSYGSGAPVLSGTVTLIGPYPSTNATSLAIDSNAFSASVAPGRYDLYAVASAGGGLPLVAVEMVTIPFASGYPIALSLTAGWTDTLTLSSSAPAPAPSAVVNWSGPGGIGFALPSEPLGSPLTFSLPPGMWTVTATGSARPFGVSAPINGSASVALVAGNAATALALSPQTVRAVSIGVAGARSASVSGSGGVASFSLTLRNTGSAPVSFHLVGSPSTWNFSFVPANLTLGVGPLNGSATAEVRIVVPPNTAVAHPPIAITAELAGGTVVGTAAPGPAISVAPVYAFQMGGSPNLDTVGPFRATLAFWAANSGNIAEAANFGIADESRLDSLGWTAQVEHGSAPVVTATALPVGQNNSFSVLLTSPRSSPVPPGSVTVVAQLANGTMESQTITLSVPTLPVSVSNGTLTVTGPSVGSPPAYPDWVIEALVFVPAGAVLIAMVSFRWWRTRRWSRR
jgi:asparagine N-glycosylation enzyme membrane subunit Stt3